MWSAVALPALAEEPAAPGPVHVFVSGSEVAFDVGVLGALLRVELAAPVLILPPDRAGAPLRTVHITRVGVAGSAGSLHVRVVPGGEATVEVGALPLDARPRALALAIAELAARAPAPVTALEKEAPATAPPAAPAPTPAPQQPPPSPPPPSVPPPDETRSRLFGELGLGLRAFPSYTTFATDLRGAMSFGWLKVDLGGTVFQTTDPLGRVTVVAPSLGVGLSMRGTAGTVKLGLGPRVEGGLIFASSSASHPDAQATSARALLLTAGAAASAEVPLEGPHRAVVSLHLGHVLSGADVRAGDRRAGGIGGPLVGLSVGYGR